MSGDDEFPIVVTTRCRHFWRQRNPIPMHPPIAHGPIDEDGVHRFIEMPPFVRLCRACAGSIETRPMTQAEFDAIVER